MFGGKAFQDFAQPRMVNLKAKMYYLTFNLIKLFSFLIYRLLNDKIINDILATSNDYMTDINYLKDESRSVFLVKWHNRIKAEFMKGLFQK